MPGSTEIFGPLSMPVDSQVAVPFKQEGSQPITQQLLLGFLFILPLILVWGMPNKTELPRWHAAVLVAPLLCVLWLARSHQKAAWSSLHLLVVASLAVNLALSLVHLDTPGVQFALQQQVALVLFFFLGAQYFSTPEGRQRLLEVASAAGALVAVIGIAQYLSGSTLGLPTVSSSNASLFVNKNYAGAFMNLATPAAFFLLLGSKGRRETTLHATGFFLCFSYSLICLSRGHWLGLAVAAAVLLVQARNSGNILPALGLKRDRLRLSGVLAAAALVLFFNPPAETESELDGSSLTGFIGNSHSAVTRAGYYRNTLQMITDHPLLGTGRGSFYTAFQRYYGAPSQLLTTNEQTGVAHAHSDYLEYLAELGIPGGMVMFALLGMFFLTARKAVSGASGVDATLQSMAFLAGITAILVHAAIDFPLNRPVTSVYLWIWVGALSGIWNSSGERAEKTTHGGFLPDPRLRGLMMLLGTAYVALVGVHAYRSLEGGRLIQLAAKATMAKQCGEAMSLADKAFSLAPADYVVWHHYLIVNGYCDGSMRNNYLSASRVLEQDPHHPYAVLVMGNVLFRAGKLELAARYYQELIDMLPHRLSGYLGMANTRLAQGRHELADKYYSRSKEIKRRFGQGVYLGYLGPAGYSLAALSTRASGDREWATRSARNRGAVVYGPPAVSSGSTVAVTSRIQGAAADTGNGYHEQSTADR